MSNAVPILKVFKKPLTTAIFAGTASTLFLVNFYLMLMLPGTDGYQCIIGSNLTSTNIGFSLILSLLAGLILAGVAYGKTFGTVGGGGIVGMVIGTFTSFCTLCTLPIISLFGISIGLNFITEHALVIKGLSLALMLGAVYLLNQQIRGKCKICAT